MMSMLEHIVQSGSGRAGLVRPRRREWPGSRHGHACAATGVAGPNVTVRTFYNAPEPSDEAGRDYDEPG